MSFNRQQSFKQFFCRHEQKNWKRGKIKNREWAGTPRWGETKLVQRTTNASKKKKKKME